MKNWWNKNKGKILTYLIIILTSFFIGSIITYFYLKSNQIKPNEAKIRELNLHKEELKNKLDSVIKVAVIYEIKVDSLQKIITIKEGYLVKINEKYEKIFVHVRNLDLDGQIELLRRYLTQEDDSGERYIDSVKSDSTGQVKFFISK